MLKGLRWRKTIGILPGVRINLSKSGVSGGLGAKGAGINIGRNGVTTNAGIPGTGLSYRQKLGGGKGLLGVLALVAGLGWWAFQHKDKIMHFFAPAPAAVTQGAAPAATPPSTKAAAQAPTGSAVRYVRRGGSVLRETKSTSGKSLKKEAKGATVTLLTVDGEWSQVRDGDLTGWMRSSVIGETAP